MQDVVVDLEVVEEHRAVVRCSREIRKFLKEFRRQFPATILGADSELSFCTQLRQWGINDTVIVIKLALDRAIEEGAIRVDERDGCFVYHPVF